MTKTIVEIEVLDVEKRRVPSKHYVYVIMVKWTDKSSMVIYRRYSRFFDLQTQLLDKFPIQAGTTDPSLRIIPFLPGKIFFGRSHIREVALKRRGEISDYCKNLLALPPHISQCEEVLEFFEVEPEDLDPPKDDPKPKVEKKAEKISVPKQLEKYVAVADYGAQEKGEMDLHAGMIVEVTEKSESGWWFVNAEEHQGWVPSTYLQAMNGSAATHDADYSTQDSYEEKYICIETFAADSSDEISLEKGAIVEVLQKNMDGWWTVRYEGSEGYAPATYLKKSTDPYAIGLVEKSRQSGVQIISNLSDVSNLLASSSASPRNSAILSSSPPTADERGAGGDPGHGEEEDRLGEVKGSKRDSLAKMVLKQRSLERGGSLKPPPRQNSVKQMVVSPPTPTSPGKPSTYLTVADFEDTVGDGISFTAGETVTVLEKTPSGWWFVARGQEQGWVPESYLEPSDTSPLQTEASPLTENGDEEEDSDYMDEESDEEEQTQPPSSALASALQNRLKGMNGDQKTSTPSAAGPPKPPNKTVAKPPLLPGKPQSQSQPESAQEQKKDTGPGLANALKSRFESKPMGLPSKPSEKPAVNKPSGPPAPPLKPTEKPGPPSLPSKPSGLPAPPSKPGEKPAPPSLPNKPAEKPAVPFKQTEKPKPPGLPSKPTDKPSMPSLPKKPGHVESSSVPGGVAGIASSLKSKFEAKEQEGSVKPAGKPPALSSKPVPPSKSFGGEIPSKPSFLHKPADEGKPVLGQKPSLAFRNSSAAGNGAKPALPSQTHSGPPRLPHKPQTSSKSASDSNNNTSGADRPVSSKIQGLAAMFGKQDDAKDTKSRPALPGKKPNPPQFPAQKPSNRDSEAPGGKPRVGNLVSELSNKLQFGGGGGGGGSGDGGSSRSPEPSPVSKTSPWSSQTRNSSKPSEPSSVPQLPNQMHNLLNKPKPAAPSKGAEYEAVADFAAEGEGELCLRCGDVVEVVNQAQQDWWLVRLHSNEGWVPSSYLEPAAQWDD